jgi:hypothetical protein
MVASFGRRFQVRENELVMPGLVPDTHVLTALQRKDVDGRDKPGHDDEYTALYSNH